MKNAAIANDNARLAILKQGEMVNCLAQLSSVLSKGLTMSDTMGLQSNTNSRPSDYTAPTSNRTTTTPNLGPAATREGTSRPDSFDPTVPDHEGNNNTLLKLTTSEP